MFRPIIVFCLLMALPICAAEFIIKSQPEEAEVSIRDPKSTKSQRLGKTPLKMPLQELVSNYAPDGNFLVEVTKEGYSPYRVMMLKASNADVNLNVNLEILDRYSYAVKFDKTVAELFEIQRLIRVKNYVEADRRISSLEKDNPYYSTIYEMKGGLYYMQKDFRKALSAYRQAFSKNPENEDAYSMMVYLEKYLGTEKQR